MTDLQHKVAVRAGGRVIENWTSYDIQIDMLTAADGFTMELGPADPVGEQFGDVWEAVAPDAEVEVLLDDIRIMSGFVDVRDGDSEIARDIITIQGRDRTGRLVDESMPLVGFASLGIKELAQKVAGPWFSRVELSNATNRRLIAGGGKGAKLGRVAKEPPIATGARAPRKVEPGDTRWSVLEYFLREAELLAWSAADGETLIVGRPNYDQEPTFHFMHAKAGSLRRHGANCIRFKVTDDIAERYSQVIAVGSNAGGAVNYGEKLTRRRGVASNGAGHLGIGRDFQRQKVLLVSDDGIKDDAQAKIRAEREMAERDAGGHQVTVTVAGHAQQLAGAARPTLYACDTMAWVTSEVYGVSGLYLITAVRFRRDRAGGELTEISLVPKGTLLKA